MKLFMEEVTEAGMVLAIVKRNVRVELEVLKEIQPLIEEYHDDLPHGYHLKVTCTIT